MIELGHPSLIEKYEATKKLIEKHGFQLLNDGTWFRLLPKEKLECSEYCCADLLTSDFQLVWTYMLGYDAAMERSKANKDNEPRREHDNE